MSESGPPSPPIVPSPEATFSRVLFDEKSLPVCEPPLRAPMLSGFLDEHPATPSEKQINAAATRCATSAVLVTEPPRPRWIRVIAVTLRQCRYDFVRFDLQNVDARASAACRTERDISPIG